MVKVQVSARVSSCTFFLNRSGLIGKRGNIPSGERVAGWRKCDDAERRPLLNISGLLRCVRNDGRDSENPKRVLPDGASGFRFIERTRFTKTTPCTVER
jgi:hypothetical protein